jgi:hypothetical protein
VEATGGKAAYRQIYNTLSRGTFEVTGTQLRGTLTVCEAQPDKTRSTLEIEGVEKIEEGTLGDLAWENSNSRGPRLKTGMERAIALREATFNSRFHWRKLYKKAECVGVETVAERSCYKVMLTPEAGKPITHFYDRDSGLLLKSVIILETPGGETLSENYYSDYKQSNTGVLFPHRLEHRVRSENTVVVLESIKCNADIAWNRFDPPSEVKGLLAKSHR